MAQGKAGEQRLDAAKVFNKPIEDGQVELALGKSHSGRAPGPNGLRAGFYSEAYVLVPAGANQRDHREYILLPILYVPTEKISCSGRYPEGWSAAALIGSLWKRRGRGSQ